MNTIDTVREQTERDNERLRDEALERWQRILRRDERFAITFWGVVLGVVGAAIAYLILAIPT